MTITGNKKVRRLTEKTSMCDLPADLVGEGILTKVPITSLKAVRSTCKLWNALSKSWIFGKAAAAAREQPFLGFMTKNSKVCSVKFHHKEDKEEEEDLPGKEDKEEEEDLSGKEVKEVEEDLSGNEEEEEEEDLPGLSIKQVDLLDQVEISRVFHCNGLLLCVAEDNLRLLIWNPYLGQTQWIGFTTGLQGEACCYALGYDNNRNHKILRFVDPFGEPSFGRIEGKKEIGYEIYEFSSNSWRVLKLVTPNPDWKIHYHFGNVSLKGNTYFYSHAIVEYVLLCFDFTTERFGPGLPLPFHKNPQDAVALSCVREEKLAVLYKQGGVEYDEPCNVVQIWVTTKIEPNNVSWSQFLRVEMEPFALRGIRLTSFVSGGSFFIDEEKKVAVVFDIEISVHDHHHMAFVIGEGGRYFKSLSLGVAHTDTETVADLMGIMLTYYRTPLVWTSSYLPSLVQLNQPHKEKEIGV